MLEHLIFANIEDKIGLTENINQALRVLRFPIHTGLKAIPFDLHHGRKLGTELTNIIKDTNSYLSDWTTLDVSIPPKEILIYVARNEARQATDLLFIAREKNPHVARHTSHQKEGR